MIKIHPLMLVSFMFKPNNIKVKKPGRRCFGICNSYNKLLLLLLPRRWKKKAKASVDRRDLYLVVGYFWLRKSELNLFKK